MAAMRTATAPWHVSPDQVFLDDGAPSTTQQPPGRAATAVIGPPESVAPAAVYTLYRGATGRIGERRHRIWAEFPALQLCWAGYDLPAGAENRLSLLDLGGCRCERLGEGSESLRLHIFRLGGPPSGPDSEKGKPGADKFDVLSVLGPGAALEEFAEALQKLLASRDNEGRSGLDFIQRRLFQYLWQHQGARRSETEILEAQAVLAFNLEPKQGVAYLREKLKQDSASEVGTWLAKMSTEKGGLDPTMLGTYFSRTDTLDVFRAFVRCLDLGGSDLVAALRILFDTFKPGGESQVVIRILELFAEAYFLQWQSYASREAGAPGPKTAWKDSDSVYALAVSLIMLNTGLHVATKKVKNVKKSGVTMTLEQYIASARGVVGPAEVPDEALKRWYEAVREVEISLLPLPRATFSNLPVQPDIEGWLIAVLGKKVQRRYWAVLALQRMYLFSDASDVEPCDAIDLKDILVRPVAGDSGARDRLVASQQTFCGCFNVRTSRTAAGDIHDLEARAFEMAQPAATKEPTLLKKVAPRKKLALVAESTDLMEKWVQLITSGPY